MKLKEINERLEQLAKVHEQEKGCTVGELTRILTAFRTLQLTVLKKHLQELDMVDFDDLGIQHDLLEWEKEIRALIE